MKTRTICIVLIALAIALAAGCGAEVRTPTQIGMASPSPTPKPSPSPTPAFSEAEKASLRASYAELFLVTKASMERERLLHGNTVDELVCKAEENLEQAEKIKATVADPKKGPYAQAVVTAEAAKALVEQQLAIWAALIIEGAKAADTDFSCRDGEGRLGTAYEALHDLVMTHDEHNVDVSRTGMDLKAIRALALARSREEVADIKAILGKKPADTSIEEVRAAWNSYNTNPWNFTPKELGFTAEQMQMLSPAE